MAEWLFRAAAFLSVLGLLAHELVGAPMVLPPLDAAGLGAEVVWLHHFSWHVGSVAVAVMASMFLYASFAPANAALAVFPTAMSVGFAGLALVLAVAGSGVLWRTPAPYLWMLISFIGGLGIVDARRRCQR